MARAEVVVTVDIDWSPDWCSEFLISELSALGITPTVFVTHESDYLKSLRDDGVELGIHPDFTRHSFETSIKDLSSVLRFYSDSELLGSRSHRNVFGQHIALWLRQEGFVYDLSTFFWQQPSPYFVDQNGLVRFSYSWEDGIHLEKEGSPNGIDFKVNPLGPSVINLHPVLLYLNVSSERARRAVTSKFRELRAVPEAVMKSHRQEFGILDSVRDALFQLKKQEFEFLTMREFGRKNGLF